MGRKLKYKTEKERRDAQRKWQMDHYQRNIEDPNRKLVKNIVKRKEINYMKKKLTICMETMIFNITRL